MVDIQADTTTSSSRHTARLVRTRIELEGERLWRFDDFHDLRRPAAVARAMSRLAKAGLIDRLSKGVYYRTRNTAVGKSGPHPAAVQALATRRHALFPSGAYAANFLGFATQTMPRIELSTSASSVPRKLIGQDTVLHTRRPATWSTLSRTDAALLDFLRLAGKASELSPDQTAGKTLALLAELGRYQRLVAIAHSEPPRVRALLGALGELLGNQTDALYRLRASLNPLSKFDFGAFADLPSAKSWQAKG